MSDQRDVTVVDHVRVTGRISLRQLEAYLDRRGWKPQSALGHLNQPATFWSRSGDRHETRICTWPEMTAENIALEVEAIARELHRQPSDVLAEIAKEAT
ncbi:hypothetical protein WMF38_57685 [Sorangium sp. So ce118]